MITTVSVPKTIKTITMVHCDRLGVSIPPDIEFNTIPNKISSHPMRVIIEYQGIKIPLFTFEYDVIDRKDVSLMELCNADERINTGMALNIDSDLEEMRTFYSIRERAEKMRRNFNKQ